MSKYCEVETYFTDEAALVAGLMDSSSWGCDQIEVYAEPQGLYGYKGDVRPEKANIAIRGSGRVSIEIQSSRREEDNISGVLWFPNYKEVRLIYLVDPILIEPSHDERVPPFYSRSSVRDKLPSPSAIAMI